MFLQVLPLSFTSTPDTTATVGTLYTYNIIATDADGDALSFTGTTLPNWLSITENGNNTATLSGTPTIAGNYPVVISANGSTLINENFESYNHGYDYVSNNSSNWWNNGGYGRSIITNSSGTGYNSRMLT